MTDNRKKLYDALSGDYDLGTFDEFSSKLSDPNNRKKLYGAVSQKFDAGDYSSFEKNLGIDVPQPISPRAVQANTQQENPILTALRQPAQQFNKGISQITSNQIAGLANLGNSALSTAALPFSVGDAALRQVPYIGEPTANAIALPFQAIGKAVELGQQGIQKGLDATGLSNYNNPEGAEAVSSLNQGLAQLLMAGKAGEAIPKTKPTSLPTDAVSAKAQATGIDKPVEQPKLGSRMKDDAVIAETPKPATSTLEQPAQVQKMIDILREAKPIRNKQEKLYSQRRAEQLPLLSNAFKNAQGEQGALSAKGVLKGELPKAQYESVRPKVEQADIDFFFNEVSKTDKISAWDKLTANEGLTKIFSKEGGSVPTKGEIAKLEEVFGGKFAEAILDKQTNWAKFKAEIPDIINLPRTLMSSFDMSMPLRQGIIQSVSHPAIAGKAFVEMHKSFVSPKAYETMKQELSSRPNAELYKDTKLHIPALEVEYKPKSLKAREDGFVSRFLQTTKIPVLKQIGTGVRMSERAALTYLSKIRADVFDMYAGELQKSGLTPEKDGATYKALAEWVNVSTGRGNYGGFERFAPTASALLFSPRLLKARLDILNPVHYATMPKEVRVKAWKDMAKFGGAVTGLLTLAKTGGANVETDPRSTDFGKIKVGNTRYEVTGGIQPVVRFLSQFTSGQRKTQDGKIVNMDNTSPYAGNRLENLLRFGQGKLNPHASLVVDLLKGQNFIGEDITMQDEVLSRVMPLYIQDATDAFRQEGLIKGTSVALPSFYGVGTNTYPPKPKPVFKVPSTTAPKLTF